MKSYEHIWNGKIESLSKETESLSDNNKNVEDIKKIQMEILEL